MFGARILRTIPFVLTGPLAVFAAGCDSKTAKESPPQISAIPSTPPVEKIPAPVDVAAPPADATKTASGVWTKQLSPGTGVDHPRPQDELMVSYVGWKKDGEMFGRSSQPMMLRLTQMFPGWAEATQLMVVGEKRRAWVPAGFAYGDHPKAGQPAGDLTLDIELVDLVKLGDAPDVPKDLKDPPPSAKRLPSGVAYALLKPGTGRTPGPDDAVVLNYSGFMTDGTVFDSSIPKGRAVAVRISKAVKGWAEGLLLMKEGEKAQFWVPAALAYGDTPAKAGGPHGDVVFVAELVKIKEPAVAQK